jgi:hypothetical protein
MFFRTFYILFDFLLVEDHVYFSECYSNFVTFSIQISIILVIHSMGDLIYIKENFCKL